MEHHVCTTAPGCRRFPTRGIWCPSPTTATFSRTDRQRVDRHAPRRRRPSSAVTSWCSPIACRPSRRPDSSLDGRTVTRSASRFDCCLPPDTHRAPRLVAGRGSTSRLRRRSHSQPAAAASPDEPCAFDIDADAATPPAAVSSPRPHKLGRRSYPRTIRPRRCDAARRRGPVRR